MTRVVETSLRPGRSMLSACAAFGVAVRRVPVGRRGGADRLASAARAVAELDATLPAGGIALIAGPSGAGKSTVLGGWCRRVRGGSGGACEVRASATRSEGSVIDALRGPVRGRLAILSSAGLAEATLLARRVRELSEGQRFRLELAVAMQRALKGSGRRAGVATLFVDEFAASLDRATARSVCAMARWARREKRVRLVAATPTTTCSDGSGRTCWCGWVWTSRWCAGGRGRALGLGRLKIRGFRPRQERMRAEPEVLLEVIRGRPPSAERKCKKGTQRAGPIRWLARRASPRQRQRSCALTCERRMSMHRFSAPLQGRRKEAGCGGKRGR